MTGSVINNYKNNSFSFLLLHISSSAEAAREITFSSTFLLSFGHLLTQRMQNMHFMRSDLKSSGETASTGHDLAHDPHSIHDLFGSGRGGLEGASGSEWSSVSSGLL